MARNFSHSTLDEWSQRIEEREIEVGGDIAEVSHRIRGGEVIYWNRPPWLEDEVPQGFDVLYEDSHIVAVNKPSGLPTLPGGGFYLNTLLSMVQRAYPEAKPMHRLGRATSGIVLFARDSRVASELTKMWPGVMKQYQALGQGVATEDAYDIRVPIGPVAHPRLGFVHAATATGKTSRSVARVIERRENETLFEVDLHTGRPHQIRIHLAAIGHPLVGDPIYRSGGGVQENHPGLPGDSGYLLHAKCIVLKHPITNQEMDFRAPVPKGLERRKT